jgi:hypothetical protein
MDTASDWQQLVRAAWDSIKTKVASELPRAVVGKGLSNQSFNPEIRICGILNTGRGGGAFWGEDGTGSMNLTELRISALNSVQDKNVTFDGTNANFPLGFSLLQASGRYAYSQPCGLYSFGKKTTGTTVRGAGGFGEKRETGALTYVATFDNATMKLILTTVAVSGNRSSEVKPDGEPDNAVLRWLSDYLGGGVVIKNAIQSALEAFFINDNFSKDLIATLNSIIGAAIAQSRTAVS